MTSSLPRSWLYPETPVNRAFIPLLELVSQNDTSSEGWPSIPPIIPTFLQLLKVLGIHCNGVTPPGNPLCIGILAVTPPVTVRIYCNTPQSPSEPLCIGILTITPPVTVNLYYSEKPPIQSRIGGFALLGCTIVYGVGC